MSVSSAEFAALIREIEVAPIDCVELPYAEDDLRLLLCSQIHKITRHAEQLGEENRQRVLLAVAARLVLENPLLNIRLLQGQGKGLDDSAAALFRRLRGRPS